jgi:hypothetical protein
MKHLYIGLGILAVILAMSILASWYLGVVTDNTVSKLETARMYAQAEDYDGAARSVQEALDAWDQYKGYCGMLLRHGETDDVLYALSALLEYAKSETDDEFFSYQAQTVAMLHHLADMERLTYYNIL